MTTETQETIDQNKNVFQNEANNTSFKNEASPTMSENNDPVFNSMVGEGKKYRTPDDLAKGKTEADLFIEQLKSENAEMRKEVEKSITLEEVLDNMNNAQNLDQGGQANHSPDTSKNLGLDEKALVEIVNSQIKSNENAQKSKRNIDSVIDTLIKREGDGLKANQFVVSKAAEIGSSVEELQKMASENPSMFYRVVGIDPNGLDRNKGVPDSGNSVNTEALSKSITGQAKQGTFQWYQELRKTDPKKYFSPQVQNEMFKNRKEMGSDAFYKK